MIYTDTELTFVPILQRDKYEELNRYMFNGRHIVDLGAGPLDLMYDHSMKYGALSYHAVESNPDYLKKLRDKLQGRSTVRDIVKMDIKRFLKRFSTSKESTIVCSGIERKFIKGLDRTEEIMIQQLHRGSRYLGVCSSFFMSNDWITGRETHHDKKQFYTYQNGDHILIAQTNPINPRIRVKTDGVAMGSGKSFGKFDESFEVPCYHHH